MITDRLSARDVIPQDIHDLIATRHPELNELEYKRNDDSDLIKAACAVANSGGGFILIGIEPSISERATSRLTSFPESVSRVFASITTETLQMFWRR